ncbi:regulatory protein, tetR family [Sinosporangium album]|uniref:Regulatory protein, tetR family n=1 Tax=Sinosporangium album TaxID=504805 RepID=A0A1G7RR99_9ACTN|nr:TetR/AcrR family transcriptional regulator C-terminal domain-containing protein [Sinosporangium album]SDG13223.1 regulatory protein, tetR family [Sinosporangium album]
MVDKHTYTSVWVRDAAKGAQPRRTDRDLSREQIVRAAIEILDAEGLDALSMRRLGAKLNAGATSIYWHVATKMDVLDLVLDEVLGEVEIPERGDWILAVSVTAHSLRETLFRHPWAAALISSRPNQGPHAVDMAERVFGIFESAGFKALDASLALTAVVSFTVGLTVSDITWQGMVAASGVSEEEWRRQSNEVTRQTISTRPRLRAFLDTQSHLDDETLLVMRFNFGLQCLLDGLAARLNKTARVGETGPRPSGGT